MRSRSSFLFGVSVIAILLFYLDQILKNHQSRVDACVFNEGFAYGLFQNIGSVVGVAFSLVALLAIFGIIFRIARESEQKRELLTLGLLLIGVGGIGNLYDRLVFGRVCDFLSVGLPVVGSIYFNLADILITIGLLMAMVYIIFHKNDSTESNGTR